MKEYFVARLPVDGEIRVGDLVKSESHISYAVKCTGIKDNGDIVTDEPEAWDHFYVYVIKKEKAIKLGPLTLCTREGLEIGDQIYGTREGGWRTIHKGEFIREHKEKNYFFIAENEHEFMCYDCFKVIGEISGDAVWIKEGDKINQQDILQIAIPTEVVEGKDGLTLYGDSDHIGIKIKCPSCKTFH